MGFIVPHRSRRKLSGFTDDKVLVENGFIVPLTKGDSREAAGGQGLSHFYHALLGAQESLRKSSGATGLRPLRNGSRGCTHPRPHSHAATRPGRYLSAEIVAAEADFVVGTLHADPDAVPLPVIYRMRRVIPKAVLIAEFSGDFIQSPFDVVVSAVSGARHKPCFAAADIGKFVQDSHVDGVPEKPPALSLRPLLKFQPAAWDRDRNRQVWNHDAASPAAALRSNHGRSRAAGTSAA